MITSRGICNTCLQQYLLSVSTDEVGLLDDYKDEHGLVSCARRCGGKVLFGHEAAEIARGHRIAPPLHVSATEFYKALGGLGLRDEVADDPDLVLALLKTNRVVDAELEAVMGRIFVHELKLENGMTVHLSSGAKGAQVLKVTRRPE